MNKENQAVGEGWPEDQADWPQTASAVQGGVSPTASVVVNDLASAVRSVINKVEQKTGFRPDLVVTKPHHAAQSVVYAPEAAPHPATNARRIAACVNACAGISTENLEDNLPVKELADRYNAVLKQRDMLLEAIEKIAKTEIDGGDISASWALISVKHLAQDVVEKVKGGAV